jgi:hypothetical protein
MVVQIGILTARAIKYSYINLDCNDTTLEEISRAVFRTGGE